MARINKKFHQLLNQNPALVQHLRLLACAGIEHYQDWCKQQGFSTSLQKSQKQLAQELATFRQQTAVRQLTTQKQQCNHPLTTIEDICQGRFQRESLHQPYLQLIEQQIQDNLLIEEELKFPPKIYCRVLQTLFRHKARFFEASVPDLLPQAGLGCNYMLALAAVARYESRWLKPIEQWRPGSKSVHKQFTSLLRHLFVKYENVPEWLESVWFAHNPATLQHQQWYLHVGQGWNLRDCDLPIPLTKKMAHQAMRAPASLTVLQAIRWGQILGLPGSTPEMAGRLVRTRLGSHFEHDEFWLTVIRWFIAHPELTGTHYGPIVDYLHHQRFMPEVLPDGRIVAGPAQPNLCMTGRTPGTLLQQVQKWHHLLGSQNLIQHQQWEPCGLAPFEYLEGTIVNDTLRTWRIRELLSSGALLVEGRRLNHCVSLYTSLCQSGQTAIWTMEKATTEKLEKLLTIEVNLPRRRICQVRGNSNREATAEEMKILSRWAWQQQLSFDTWL